MSGFVSTVVLLVTVGIVMFAMHEDRRMKTEHEEVARLIDEAIVLTKRVIDLEKKGLTVDARRYEELANRILADTRKGDLKIRSNELGKKAEEYKRSRLEELGRALKGLEKRQSFFRASRPRPWTTTDVVVTDYDYLGVKLRASLLISAATRQIDKKTDISSGAFYEPDTFFFY